jgi:hypothetical protein
MLPGFHMTKKILFVLTCGLLAGCATGTLRPASAPANLAGTKLEFTDLHSANTYEFMPGGRYRFTALSQNGLRTDRRDGTFVGKRTGREARVVFDDNDVIRLTFEHAASGFCQLEGDVRTYRFRLVAADGRLAKP